MRKLRLSAAFMIILLLIAVTGGIMAVQAAEPAIPNPTKEFYFNDFAGVMKPDTGRDITRLGERINKATEGGQVVFVCIAALDGSTIEEYANTLFNKWKIGTKDRGILFILSMEERESRIEVGYGYEGILTDLESSRLLEKFAALYKEEGIDEAVKTVYEDICSIVIGDGDSVSYPEDSAEGSGFIEEHPLLSLIGAVIILILIILDFVLTGGRITFFIIRMAAASGRRGGGGGGRRNSGGGGRSGGGGASSRF